MLISKINACCSKVNACQTNNMKTSFKGILPSPKKCFDMPSDEFFYKYGGYKGIISYEQIMALKNLSEETKKCGMNSNLAIAFVADPVDNGLFATSQDDLIKGTATWTMISDYDSM